jgi:hypothetical protein
MDARRCGMRRGDIRQAHALSSSMALLMLSFTVLAQVAACSERFKGFAPPRVEHAGGMAGADASSDGGGMGGEVAANGADGGPLATLQSTSARKA